MEKRIRYSPFKWLLSTKVTRLSHHWHLPKISNFHSRSSPKAAKLWKWFQFITPFILSTRHQAAFWYVHWTKELENVSNHTSRNWTRLVKSTFKITREEARCLSWQTHLNSILFRRLLSTTLTMWFIANKDKSASCTLRPFRKIKLLNKDSKTIVTLSPLFPSKTWSWLSPELISANCIMPWSFVTLFIRPSLSSVTISFKFHPTWSENHVRTQIKKLSLWWSVPIKTKMRKIKWWSLQRSSSFWKTLMIESLPSLTVLLMNFRPEQLSFQSRSFSMTCWIKKIPA